MKSEDQHIVPRVYLKQFTDSGKKFWRYNVKSNVFTRPKQVTPAQVCYRKDFYKITSEKTLREYQISEDYLEKKGLSKFETNFEKICGRIKRHEKFIIRKEAQLLLSGLVQMKLRNTWLQETVYNSTFMDKTIIETLSRMKGNIRRLEDTLGIRLFEEMERKKNELLKSKSSRHDLYLRMLIEETLGQNAPTKQAIEFLMASEWFIFTTKPQNTFITSDNPGFCVDGKEKLLNIYFNEKFTFCFPLSPLHTLIVSSKYLDKKSDELAKYIQFRNADEKLVRIINRAAIALCNKEVYSYSKPTLEYWIHDFKNISNVAS